MNRMIILLTLSFLTSHLWAAVYKGFELEDKRNINGVILQTGKVDDLRLYYARLDEIIDSSFGKVFERLVHFEQRCNNDYREKRVFFPKDHNCPIHNANVVENQIIRTIKKGHYKKLPNEVDRFLMRRNIYNRESFFQYDLVIVRKWKEGKVQKGVITYKMMNLDEVSKYIDGPKPINSAFENIEGSYIVTQLDSKTKVQMLYSSQTTHWLLNKGVSVGLIYKNIAKGTKNTLVNISNILGAKIYSENL